ncbi:hypothetical protein ACIF8T_38400 [Streptomyces sp. NPDC085946]|uniref:hypothetical protein n=1 Tax=Streptomyces sp. NPDC085946 TaxID=3365744 RepID=UPI0037CFCEC4
MDHVALPADGEGEVAPAPGGFALGAADLFGRGSHDHVPGVQQVDELAHVHPPVDGGGQAVVVAGVPGERGVDQPFDRFVVLPDVGAVVAGAGQEVEEVGRLPVTVQEHRAQARDTAHVVAPAAVDRRRWRTRDLPGRVVPVVGDRADQIRGGALDDHRHRVVQGAGRDGGGGGLSTARGQHRFLPVYLVHGDVQQLAVRAPVDVAAGDSHADGSVRKAVGGLHQPGEGNRLEGLAVVR